MQAPGAGGYYTASLTTASEARAPSNNGWSIAGDGRVKMGGKAWANAGSSNAFRIEIEALPH